jgi:hypothetical protein
MPDSTTSENDGRYYGGWYYYLSSINSTATYYIPSRKWVWNSEEQVCSGCMGYSDALLEIELPRKTLRLCINCRKEK